MRPNDRANQLYRYAALLQFRATMIPSSAKDQRSRGVPVISQIEIPARPDPAPSTFGSFESRYYRGEARSETVADSFALDHLLGRLDEKAYGFLSLDVFDTLMLRNGKCERRRFWEIAERWRQQLPVDAQGVEVLDLYLARVRAAQVSYSCGPILSGTQEGRLDSLVGVALSLLKLPQTLAPSFMAIELEYEVENLAANPLVLKVLEHYARQDGQVMLLSDMYLAGEQIHWIISQFGLGDVAPYIYSSADCSVNKRSGTVFGVAAREHRLAPGEFFHIGDNFHSDFSMPRLAGWAAQHLPIPLCEERTRERDERSFLDSIDGADL
jgi:hypothetical protein